MTLGSMCPVCQMLNVLRKISDFIRRESGWLLCRFLVFCSYAFNSVMVSLASCAVKSVKLGHPEDWTSLRKGSNAAGSRVIGLGKDCSANDNMSLIQTSVDKKPSQVQDSGCGVGGDDLPSGSSMQNQSGSNSRPDNGKTTEGETAGKARAPRKMVSINDNVEEFYIGNKRKRTPLEKWPSMDGEKDQVKPLKSILKVGSKQR